MKDVGLVGVPYAGKSTLFTAITRVGAAGGRANQAVVPVPDPRLGVLTEMERSAKTVAAQVRFVDVPGGTSSAQAIAALREPDALGLVLRCFGGDASPGGELATLRTALLLADLEVLGQGRVLGVVDQQVVQQQTRPLHVAPGLLHQRHQGAVRATAQEAHRAGVRRKLTRRAY